MAVGFISAAEAAGRLGCSMNAFYMRVRRDAPFKTERVGRALLVDEASFMAWLAKHKEQQRHDRP